MKIGTLKQCQTCKINDFLFLLYISDLYLQLKGCSSEDVSKEVEDMIEVLGLQQKRKALSHTLSGGQKRKLSVGIALIAGSKVYFSTVK